jgi:AcrR family transcriptional regulator
VGTPGSRSSYHHGDLPSALLDAVAEIIRERGIGFVSLREAARRAGVSHAAPAHHFGNKAGLLTAFCTQGYQRLAEYVLGEVERVGPGAGLDTLEAVGRGYVRFALDNPEHFGIMFRPELIVKDDPGYVAASDAAYDLLVATVERCRAEGSLGGRDAETVAVGAWSLVHGLASLWISGLLGERIAETDPRELAGRVSHLFVETLAAAAPHASHPPHPGTGSP